MVSFSLLWNPLVFYGILYLQSSCLPSEESHVFHFSSVSPRILRLLELVIIQLVLHDEIIVRSDGILTTQ